MIRKVSYCVDLEEFHSWVSRGPMGRLKQGAGRGRVHDLGHMPLFCSMGGIPWISWAKAILVNSKRVVCGGGGLLRPSGILSTDRLEEGPRRWEETCLHGLQGTLYLELTFDCDSAGCYSGGTSVTKPPLGLLSHRVAKPIYWSTAFIAGSKQGIQVALAQKTQIARWFSGKGF